MNFPSNSILSALTKIETGPSEAQQDIDDILQVNNGNEQEKEEKIIKEESLAELPKALNALFKVHGVASLRDIRTWLREFKGSVSASRASYAKDDILHEAIISTNNVTCIRRCYMQTSTGSPYIDDFRSIVLKVIEKKEIIKRNDIMIAAKALNVKVTAALFNKVLKSLCTSKEGHAWILKNGISS